MFIRYQVIVLLLNVTLVFCLQGTSDAIPFVGNIIKSSDTIKVGETMTLTVLASGIEPLQFEWKATKGEISLSRIQSVVFYTAPNTPGSDTVEVKVIDGHRLSAPSTLSIQVEPKIIPTPTSPPTPTLTPTSSPTTTLTPTSTPIATSVLTPTSSPNPMLDVFRIDGEVDIRNTNGQAIKPVNDIYVVKVGETITMTVHFTNPDNPKIGVTWTTRHGQVPPAIDKTTNTYTAPSQPGVDHVTIEVWDRETGVSLAPYSLSLTVVE